MGGAEKSPTALMEAIASDFRGPNTWRPIRAGVEHIVTDMDGRVWMTTAEFTTWLTEQEILRKRRKDPVKPCDAVGIGDTRRRTLLHGRDTPSKAEALACAHYARRLPLPPAAENSASFAPWVEENFGGVRTLGAWLRVDPMTISGQMSGYRINARGERVQTKVDPTLARALDWLVRVGPFCPYGERPAARHNTEA